MKYENRPLVSGDKNAIYIYKLNVTVDVRWGQLFDILGTLSCSVRLIMNYENRTQVSSLQRSHNAYTYNLTKVLY
jgi:hypothetical protein